MSMNTCINHTLNKDTSQKVKLSCNVFKITLPHFANCSRFDGIGSLVNRKETEHSKTAFLDYLGLYCYIVRK